MRRFMTFFFGFCGAILILLSNVLAGAGSVHASLGESIPKVPVFEYHHIDPGSSRWGRSVQQFKDDLLWFYNNGYVLMSLEDFTNGDFSRVPAGKKPFVLTFDDSLITQFQYLKDGSVDPNCAVAILDDFYGKHPDFGRAVTFYLNANPFGQQEFVKKKLEYLHATGREIGLHTLLHTSLKKVDAKGFQKILIDQLKALQPVQPAGMVVDSFAYPYGVVPKSGVDALKSGDQDGVHYAFRTAMLVGADPTPLLNSPGVDPYRLARIQGIDSEFLRHFGRKPGETASGTYHEKFMPYVAGGGEVRPEGGATQQVQQTRQLVETQQTFGTQQSVRSHTYAKDAVYEIGMILGRVHPGDLWKHVFGNPVFEKIYRRMRIQAVRALVPDYRGVYLTAYSAGSQLGQNLMQKAKEAGANLIVFDMKETDGHLFYPTVIELNKKAGGNGRIFFADPKKFIEQGKQMGFHMVARIVSFKDQLMAVKKPEWAIHDFKGGIWKSPEGQTWLDPSLPEVQDYVIGVAKEAAAFGADEVQFDYVRFPTQGNVANANYSFDEKKTQHFEVIRDFLKKAHRELAPLGVRVGVDIFGVVVWNNQYDSNSTGQRIGELAPYIDVVYPMAYPSHFGPGFAGRKNPGDDPYFFVHETVKLFQELVADYPVIVRPWIQAFPYKVTGYNGAYVQKQVDAARDDGVDTFILWNAGNNYDVAWPVFASKK